MIRGARVNSQSGCAVIILSINLKSLSGSFWTLTSTSNVTCWFSGYKKLDFASSNDDGENGENFRVEHLTYFHKERNCSCKSWNGLFRLLDGPNMLHSILSIPHPLSYFACNRPEHEHKASLCLRCAELTL